MQDVTITNLEGFKNDYGFTLIFCTGWLLWIPLSFLRKTLDHHHSELVSVKDELNLIKLYLSIQEVRFKDRLRVSYDIDPASMESKIPPFTLQPIIENALVHGIEPVSDSGNLLIKTSVDKELLHILVQDDGAGLNKSGIKEGIGLSNIKGKLENIYGKQFEFNIRNHHQKGTVVEINIPLVKNKSTNQHAQ